MNLDWQNAAVLLLVAAACAYLARLVWQSIARKKAASCGACGSCPADAAQGVPEVIGLSSTANAQQVVAGPGTKANAP